MKETVFVFGHKNPDTDSICSSIAYAELKKQLGNEDVIPKRLGKVNKESEFVLNYFGIPEPGLLKNVKPQVDDLKIDEPVFVYEHEPIKKAIDLMEKKDYSSIPVLNSKNYLKGVAIFSEIADSYLNISDESMFRRYRTRFQNLVEVLDAEVICGKYPFEHIDGDIYTYSTLAKGQKLSKGDIVVKGTGDNLKEIIEKTGAGCIIIPQGNQINESIDTNSDCAVLSVKHSFFKIIKLMTQSISVSSVMNSTDYKFFKTNDYVDGVKDVIKNSEQRFFPVVNDKNELVGIMTGKDLINYDRKKVILIDHNEMGQSVEGLERAKILEIVDHHRVAEIHTPDPLFFRAEPVGCTSTIVKKLYDENGKRPSKEVAGIMLSAIISDTLLFKSPTSTKDDQKAAKELAEIAGVDIQEFGLKVLQAGASIEGKDLKEIVDTDMKEFSFGDKKIMVSQFVTVDTDSFVKREDEISEFLEGYCAENEAYAVMFAATNIITEGSQIFAGGTGKDDIKKIFNIFSEKSKFIPGILSRKKQIIPDLTKYFSED